MHTESHLYPHSERQTITLFSYSTPLCFTTLCREMQTDCFESADRGDLIHTDIHVVSQTAGRSLHCPYQWIQQHVFLIKTTGGEGCPQQEEGDLQNKGQVNYQVSGR